jgi:aminoglycoside/choline kinase family phosphotransferase
MQALQNWLRVVLESKSIVLTPLSGDAGFRHYYRFQHNNHSLIAVDAPPKYSNNPAFIFMQSLLKQQKVNTPDIIAVDLPLGFFCLSDFGDQLFSDVINEKNMRACYQQAIQELIKVTTCKISPNFEIESYDKAFVYRELTIFTEWLLNKHLNIVLTLDEEKQLAQNFAVLSDNFLSQPQVLVHRDFHSRNIMVLSDIKSVDSQLGIIDFQDAVIGPITYDIVSLLRDCYLKWPQKDIDELFAYFYQAMAENDTFKNISTAQWQRWFDLTGMQRHLKASGIFARLHYRDDKSAYLHDIPLTLTYISDISAKYDELDFLHQLIVHKVIPAMNQKHVGKT